MLDLRSQRTGTQFPNVCVFFSSVGSIALVRTLYTLTFVWMRFGLFLICCWSFCSAFAQEPNYFHYNMENGLISYMVFKLQQTSDHRIWIGDHHAVSTFDGSEFNHFMASKGFPYTNVFDIDELENGKILFSPPSQFLVEYDPTTETFESIRLSPLDSARFFLKEKASLVEDRDGNIKLGFVWQGGSCTIYKDNSVCFHSDSTRNGIQLEVHPNGVLFYEHPFRGTSVYLDDKEFKNALQQSNSQHLNAVMLDTNTVLVSLDKRLLLFEKGELILSKDFPHFIIGLDSDADNNVWVSLYKNGTHRYVINNSELQNVGNYLKDYSITSVLMDHEKGYWFATLKNGIFYTPKLTTAYWDEKRGLPGSSIHVMSGNGKDEVLVGFPNNSLATFQHGRLSQILPIDEKLPIGTLTQNLTGVTYDERNDRYWLAGGGVFSYENGTTTSLDVPFHYCFAVHLDKKNNNLWIGGRRAVTHLKPNGEFGPVLNAQYALNIATDQNNELLFLSRRNVMKLATDSLSLVPVDSLSGKTTYKMEHWGTTIAFMTAKEGSIVNSEFGTQTFTAHHGYYNSMHRNGNYLWATTTNGSDKINLEHPEVNPYNFSFEHGILDANHGALHIQNDTLWLAAGKGLYVLDISKIEPAPISAPQILNVTNKDSAYKYLGDTLELPANQNNLTFHFKTITFKHQGRFHYEYRLSSSIEDFVAVNSNEVSINGLKSGVHTFEVRAVTSNGVYSPVSAWSFRIATPFWETWWFALAVALLIAPMSFLTFRAVVRRAQIKAGIKAETESLIHSLKLQSIHAQFNPHFTFNAMSSIQQLITPTTAREAKEYLGKFAGVMRSILVNSEKEQIPLLTEVEVLTAYLELEQLRFGDRLKYRIDVDDNIDMDYEQVPPMLFQPLVENAIKYGIFNKHEGGLLSIHFALANNVLTCTVEDNGVGRKEALRIQQHKRAISSGKGIQLVKDRLKVVNQGIEDDFNIVDLYDTDGKALGTRVVIKLAVND